MPSIQEPEECAAMAGVAAARAPAAAPAFRAAFAAATDSPAMYAEVAMTIRRPRRVVATVMFDARNDTAWIEGLRKSALVSPPLRAGSTIAQRWRLLGRSFPASTEVVRHVPGRSLELLVGLPLPLRIQFELEGIPEGSIARITVQAPVRGAVRLLLPLLDAWLRRRVIGSLSRLKELVEAGPR